MAAGGREQPDQERVPGGGDHGFVGRGADAPGRRRFSVTSGSTLPGDAGVQRGQGDDPRLLRLMLEHGADVWSLDSWKGTGLVRAGERG